jgi:flagellar motor switch protein FliN/FliY
MGTAATTLFTLLGQKVTITTPRVSETNMSNLQEDFEDPLVMIHIKYKIGIEGLNLLILKESDVKIITDLMMGGDGTNVPEELTDLHLSAISEAMNQMIGSASTSLSEMLATKVDISPPEAIYEAISNIDISTFGIDANEPLVKTAFKMTVGDLIDSEIMQILPVDVAKQLVTSLLESSTPQEMAEPEMPAPAAAQTPPPMQETPQAAAPQPPPQAPPMQPQQPMQQPVYAEPQQQPMYQQAPPRQHVNPVNAQPFQYESFDSSAAGQSFAADIALIKDVPLEITVELGRATKKISEILEFGVGTVIELDRLVGESLDILANGRKIAKGEVVVVDENYGVRITDIVVPEKRINNA